MAGIETDEGRAWRRALITRWRCAIIVLTSQALLPGVNAGERASPGPAVEGLLAAMQSLAAETDVQFQNRERPMPQLVAAPAFRYSDAPRGFEDAALWIWVDQGRPVALQKTEAMRHWQTGAPMWGYCFTSLATDLLTVQWGDRRTYSTREAGLAYVVLEGAPAPGRSTSERRLQCRRIAGQFTATLREASNDDSQVMRLLPKAIYENREPSTELYRGAVFGLTSNGTNPDAVILIEASLLEDGQEAWRFAAARMTNGEITVRYGERDVWHAGSVKSTDGVFANWTFFMEPRDVKVVNSSR